MKPSVRNPRPGRAKANNYPEGARELTLHGNPDNFRKAKALALKVIADNGNDKGRKPREEQDRAREEAKATKRAKKEKNVASIKKLSAFGSPVDRR